MDILLKFNHGIGDAAQFTAVLRALKTWRPNWVIDIQTKQGKDSLFKPLVRQTYLWEQPVGQHDQVLDLNWYEAGHSYPNCPSSKVERCLEEIFQIPVDNHPHRYEVQVSPHARFKAEQYFQEIGAKTKTDGKRNVVLIHYEGNTSGAKKNLPHEVIQTLCQLICKSFHIPVILDWDGRSPLVDQASIKCPDGQHWLWDGQGVGSGEQIAALIERAAMVLAIDSGPQKIAAALETPLLAVWTQHHPVHYIQPGDHILNLVPLDHDSHIRNPREQGFDYFKDNYRYKVYSNLRAAVMEETYSTLFPKEKAITVDPNHLGAAHYDERYYLEHQQAGLDYLGHGDWQIRYARWIIEALDLKGKHVIDLGCACGSVARGFGAEGAVICGVDLSEYMIQLGRDKWPDMTPLLHVCDVVNLHPFDDGMFDLAHSAQSAEHWRPDYIPMILREIHRVTKPGGLFFCSLDTLGLYERQGRDPKHEDPTHFCIKPMKWWHWNLEDTGWEVLQDSRLDDHPGNYFRKYDWDWWLARKV